MRYEFFEHTGDAKFRAYGSSLDKRFSNAALAVSSIMIDPADVTPNKERSIGVQAGDLNSLLYNFIEEILFLLDSQFFLLHAVKTLHVSEGENYALVATLTGDVNTGQYDIEGGVKAATYNEMEFTDDYIQMVVDI